MKQLLYFGDFDCTTGFGNVSKELISHFSKENLFITVFATNNHSKEPYNFSENVYVIPALKTRDGDDDDLYARKSFLKLIYNGNYDLVFCLNDLEVINELTKHLKEVKFAKSKANKKSFKTVFYFPIDSPIRKKDLDILSFVDVSATYTDYAKQEVKNHLGFSNSFKKLKVIPHGVSSTFKKNGMYINKNFTFGSVNRNSVRKDFGTLIYAFSLLKKKKEYQDSVLKLHCNPLDPFGLNLYRLCQRLELEIDKDVYFPEDFNENKGFSEEELNKFYNSLDCFITTTTAEGWGLTVHEAMACETLVICPMHTSLQEITNQGEAVIPIWDNSPTVFKDDFEKIRYVSNAYEVEEAMIEAINMTPSVRAKKILDAKKIASKYNWKKTAEMFYGLIQRQIG
jgi:glycosyltransferase involved in cell wall biosynthesis|tara:strand:- start:1291 stop:2481 length:1191 start_codon:yes stop_codon:yes gene_type:complete